MAQHLAPFVQKLRDNAGRDATLGDLNGRLDHRQDESLDAESVMVEVAPLRCHKAVHQMIGVGMIGQKGREPLLRQAKHRFVVPERVVGIETDCGNRHCLSPLFLCGAMLIWWNRPRHPSPGPESHAS